jgi:hypothetical protein
MPFPVWTRGETGWLRHRCERRGRRIGGANRFRRDRNPTFEVIQKQLSRLPARRELTGTTLGIIFATMMLTTLSLLLFFLR